MQYIIQFICTRVCMCVSIYYLSRFFQLFKIKLFKQNRIIIIISSLDKQKKIKCANFSLILKCKSTLYYFLSTILKN